ncbi:alpha-amylase [Sphingobacterium sp. DK4209]|uniref:Alpha-amylase n=1 Tax=Sphingobacterium zhuxiongii TaxID=2662364 RepID=A0A5Q0Q4L1_9SPHI|nr:MULTISPECIES: glycoside hydrolase family 13 protein [unclassified Sphingobacterium]MVZ66261.1 alpha-amylase [Sphingobacterium sp. DK4209]QGA24985.1 alpha-amylase [Sphingobacterium sp. dk4302]
MRIVIAIIFICFHLVSFAQVNRIEPLNWWVGMNNPNVQLLIYGDNISKKTVEIDYTGVELINQHKVENPNYLFLDLKILPTAKAGNISLLFKEQGKKTFVKKYELKSRDESKRALQGVNASDFVYLIMPDRFANGDPSNDRVKGMADQSLNRDSMYYRHGGDLQGIINNLDYLQELGVTALWLNPVLTNDQPLTSYHGYANTESYHVDPRFGGNEAYRKLIDACHKRGIKMIQDLVHNHFGTEHYTIKDMPMKDWVHQWNTFTKTNYREQVHMDPYAAKSDKDIMLNGWFDRHMPDMNQDNPYVKNYITQSHIWWIEEMGIDGFRLDTYAYNDLAFMSEWGKAIDAEYPKMTYFGETWVHGIPNQAYFTKSNRINQGIDTKLQGVTDFQAYWAINEALNGKFGWMDGVVRLYNTFASDFMYEDPYQNVVFLDNHDLSRYLSVVGEDFNKYKSGIAWLLTTRGIPQLYYGTEILMKNFASPDGLVREDFPGGWSKDKANKFNRAGRSEKENEAFDYVKTLANYRKNNPVLQDGKMLQYIPEDGIYVYFRYDDHKRIMIVMNSKQEAINLQTKRFQEGIAGRQQAINIVTGAQINSLEELAIPAVSTQVFELKK